MMRHYLQTQCETAYIILAMPNMTFSFKRLHDLSEEDEMPATPSLVDFANFVLIFGNDIRGS